VRISARNQIEGTIMEVKKGATTAHVLINIGDIDIGGPVPVGIQTRTYR
jgi:molybdopterin-binding protein